MNNYLWKGRKNEHRVIMEEYLGRKLEYNEVVHHINGDKGDNRIENLQLISRDEHAKLHAKPKTMRKMTCAYCHIDYKMLESDYKYKSKKGTTNFYCSKKCAGMNKSPPHTTKISDEIINLVIGEYHKGISGYSIAKNNNLTTSQVYYIIHTYL